LDQILENMILILN